MKDICHFILFSEKVMIDTNQVLIKTLNGTQIERVSLMINDKLKKHINKITKSLKVELEFVL